MSDIERVGVKGDLGVEANKLPGLGDDQRIDLEQAHVLGDEGRIELAHQILRLLGEIVVQAERLRDSPPVMRHDAGRRIDREGQNLLGGWLRATSSMSMPPSVDTWPARASFPVDQSGEIELALDGRAFLDIEPVDLLAVRKAGLVGHESSRAGARLPSSRRPTSP